jgi:hypothetical protein
MLLGRGIIGVGAVLGVLLVATGCDPGADDGLEAESFDFRKGGGGGCGGGTWIGNGLVDPDVSDVDPAYGLDTNAGLDPDADSIQLATYLVECALPEGDVVTKTVQGQAVELEGALGLAPEWKDGACDDDCQAWVSACLLARVNVTGETVDLWLAADHPAIGLGRDDALVTYEATFYGNLFQAPEVRSVCRGPQGGQLGDYLDDRTCDGQPPEDCGFTDWGDCSAVDRCLSVSGFATECATGGDPDAGVRYHSISTFVSIEAWEDD